MATSGLDSLHGAPQAHPRDDAARRPVRLSRKRVAHFMTATRSGRILSGCLGIVLFVALWRYAELSGWARPGTIPDPFGLPAAFWQEWHSHRLLPAVESSLIHYAWGLSLGTVLGLGLGALTALSSPVNALCSGLIRILRPIPPLAWVVFAIAWFGVSHAGAAFVISISTFWINYFGAYSAVRGVDPKYYELARAFEQDDPWGRFAAVTLPASLPGVLAGVRTGVGQAWMALIAAELLGVPGMGQEMNAAAGVGAYDTVVVYMLVISFIYALCDYGVMKLEGSLLQWRPS